MNNNDIILKADNLYFSYDDEKTHSLNGLSLEIPRGQKIAFMGANGSGKSTFFLCCTGIHKPSSGTLYYNGEPYSYDRKGLLKLRSKIGIVFQDPDNQLFSASVYQEISFGVLNLGYSEEDAKKAVEDVIAELEITSFRHKPTHALSGGQKKQVAIADILVMHPEVMILDEPAAALDMKHTKKVNEMIERLTEKGITVLIATHDIEYACGWADEIVLMHEGKVIRHAETMEICQDEEALKEAELEIPTVIRMYRKLTEKKILSDKEEPPRTWEELESRLT